MVYAIYIHLPSTKTPVWFAFFYHTDPMGIATWDGKLVPSESGPLSRTSGCTTRNPGITWTTVGVLGWCWQKWHVSSIVPSGKLIVCYGKIAMFSVFTHKRMVIFHSYVSLPEGT